MQNQNKYLPGLNSLRFFAAFFVVISHGAISLDKLGIQPHPQLPFLLRGGDAVDFFFTLSGFLITYLLISEIKGTGTVSLKNFYLRRVLRIWPLYFIVVAAGFFLLGFIYPAIYHKKYFSFSVPEGLLMFIFFLPNYAAKNFAVGLLYPLWSIGVEEQFYLFWAPVAKFARKRMLMMIISFIILSLMFYAFIEYGIIEVSSNWKNFFLTQKFFSMAIGSLFGYILYSQPDWYGKSFWSSKFLQVPVVAFILWHFFLHPVAETGFLFKVLMSFGYGFLILNVAGKIFGATTFLDHRWFMDLGAISYGIYMYHMLADYFLRIVFARLQGLNIPAAVLVGLYYVLLLSITIAIASLSYRYIEKYFLSLKEKVSFKKKQEGYIQ